MGTINRDTNGDCSGASNLWVTWSGAGFASFNKTTHTSTPYTNKTLPGLTITQTLTLLEDKFGLLWVETQNGGLLPSHTVRCFAEDQAGSLWIGTAMVRSLEDGFSSGQGAAVKQQLELAIPLSRYAEAVEFARLFLFLVNDDSKFITGTTQVIDGGLSVQ